MPHVHVLDLPTCDRLLRRGVFGRVGVVTPRGPEIVPVNYSVHGDAVLVRTEPGGLLARYADGAAVVFEVDAVDHEYWRGFSVFARGTGEVLDRLPDTDDCPPPRPWADGERVAVLRIAWTELTGRAVGRPTGLEALLPVRRVLA
jgi:hypothetical protein